MSRLELIVMSEKLSTDEARALLGPYVADELDADERSAVEAAVAEDADLAQELTWTRQTQAVLAATERPEPPSDMVARVRRALAEEKVQAQAEPASTPVRAPAPEPSWFSGWMQIGLGVSAACAVAVALVFVVPGTDAGRGQVGAAGVGAVGQAQADLVVVGTDAATVQKLAQAHDLVADSPDGLVFTGTRRNVQRFRLALLDAVSAQGGQVQGVVPEADQVEIRVSVRP